MKRKAYYQVAVLNHDKETGTTVVLEPTYILAFDNVGAERTAMAMACELSGIPAADVAEYTANYEVLVRSF
jgi:hypothetical protein